MKVLNKKKIQPPDFEDENNNRNFNQKYPMSTIKSNDNIMQQSKTHKYSTSISRKWKSEIAKKTSLMIR